jgi:hypothetical protein
MSTATLRLALEIAERSIALAQGQLPPLPTPPDPGGIVVHPGDDLQLAITEAPPGARLLFEPGAYYNAGSALYLGSKPITLACAGPLPDRRLTPDDAPLLPILASGTLDRTIDGTNARDVKIDGISFESRSDGLGEIIVWQDAERVRMDRVLIICGPNGQKRPIRGNGKAIGLTRSHIANVWREGQDSQCFCAWDGAGPIAIVNNYLEAASENVMIGGSDSSAPDKIPTGILIADNTFRKRAEWVAGAGYVVKNLLEFKCGRYVVVTRNDFRGCWTDAQNGYALLFKSVNQDGGSPWTALTDFAFIDNTIDDVENGINVSGYDYNQASGQTTRGVIARNRITCSGTAFQVGGEVGDLAITDNEIHQGGNLLTIYAGEVWPAGEVFRAAAYAAARLVFTNNRSNDVPYGIKGDGCASGEESLRAFCREYTYTGNTYHSPTRSIKGEK